MIEFTLGTIGEELEKIRTEFRETLYERLGFSKYTEVIHKGLGMCTGSFEEKTLQEVLQEEFNEFLEATLDAEKEVS